MPQALVQLPEIGLEVRVRGMTAAERDSFEQELLVDGKPNLLNTRAKLAAICCVQEDGSRLFTDADVVKLGSLRASVIDRIATKARELSGIGGEDEDEEKKG